MNSGSKKVRQGRATREALLAAARVEFGVRGFADTSVDAIVGRAQVTKGAFYHHFSGKEGLFLRVFENVERELGRAAFVTHVDHVPFADPQSQSRRLNRFADQTNGEVWQQLLERCRRFIELHTDPAVRRIVLEDAPWVLGWSERQRIAGEFGVTLLRADLRRAMRRGLIVDLPLRVLSVVLAGALNEACLLVANAADPDRVLDESLAVVAKFLEGLQAG